MRYRIYTRPTRVGGGYRFFKAIESDSRLNAIDFGCTDTQDLAMPDFHRPSAKNPGKDGTLEKPLSVWGSSEVVALTPPEVETLRNEGSLLI